MRELTQKKRRRHPADCVTDNLHDYIVNAARALKAQAIDNRRGSSSHAAIADRYYAKLKEIADLFGIECWTVNTLPAKLRKFKPSK